jgi:hypothetical protein
MEEDAEDRIARLAREKEEKQLHKLTKLAHALRMDVKVIKEMEEKSRIGKKYVRLGTKTKEVVWRRRGIMKLEVGKLTDVLSFQRVIGRESVTNLDLRVSILVMGVVCVPVLSRAPPLTTVHLLARVFRPTSFAARAPKC